MVIGKKVVHSTQKNIQLLPQKDVVTFSATIPPDKSKNELLILITTTGTNHSHRRLRLGSFFNHTLTIRIGLNVSREIFFNPENSTG
jgi:hypothetical protein